MPCHAPADERQRWRHRRPPRAAFSPVSQRSARARCPHAVSCRVAGSPPAAHLGRHVVQSAAAREGQLLCGPDGEPQIAHLELGAARQENVLRLDVPAAQGGGGVPVAACRCPSGSCRWCMLALLELEGSLTLLGVTFKLLVYAATRALHCGTHRGCSGCSGASCRTQRTTWLACG